MTEKDYLKKYDIRIIIISRGRSETITTNKIFPDYIEVLVPDSEKELYENNIDNPILTIPDEVKGLGEVRNWCLENFNEEILVMVDDDISRLYCLSEPLSKEIKDPEEVVQIIINAAVMAKDMNVHCFGFSQTDIRKYNGTEPFKLSTWVGCVIGIVGRKYKFRKDKFKVDIDFCLQNLLVDRIIFCDNRYLFSQKRDCNVGGNSIFRTDEEYKKSVESLSNKWGKYLKIKNNYSSNIRINLNVQRRQSIEYEK